MAGSAAGVRPATDTTGTFQSSRVYSDAAVYHPSHTSRSALWIAVLVALDMVNWTFYGWWKEIFYYYYWYYRPPLFMSLMQTFEAGSAVFVSWGTSSRLRWWTVRTGFLPPSFAVSLQRGRSETPCARHQDAGTGSCSYSPSPDCPPAELWQFSALFMIFVSVFHTYGSVAPGDPPLLG